MYANCHTSTFLQRADSTLITFRRPSPAPGLVRRTRLSPELKFRHPVAQQLGVLAERSEAQQSGVVGPAQFVEQHPSQAPLPRSAKWGGFTGVLHSPGPGRPRRGPRWVERMGRVSPWWRLCRRPSIRLAKGKDATTEVVEPGPTVICNRPGSLLWRLAASPSSRPLERKSEPRRASARHQSGPKARTGSALAWMFAQKFCANIQRSTCSHDQTRPDWHPSWCWF